VKIYSILILSLVSFLLGNLRCIASPSSVIAKVNGQPITNDDLFEEQQRRNQLDSSSALNQDELLERIILYRLAVQQAKKLQLTKNTETQKKIDKVLYQSFLDYTVQQQKEKGAVLEPTLEEQKQFYEMNPWIRLNHLVIRSGTAEEEKVNRDKISVIQNKLKEGIPFSELTQQYSQEEFASHGGDLDFRGKHNLPEPIYHAAVGLKKGEVSSPIILEKSTHLVQLTDKKSFDEAPAAYREYLKKSLRDENEKKLLLSSLQELRKKAKVQKISAKIQEGARK
jgi:parvulin-like peptidyl-prolyl isomerase